MCCAHIKTVSQTFSVIRSPHGSFLKIFESHTRESRHTVSVKDPCLKYETNRGQLHKWALIRKKATPMHQGQTPPLPGCASSRDTKSTPWNNSLGAISTLARYLLMWMCLLDDLPEPTTYIQLHHITHCKLVGFKFKKRQGLNLTIQRQISQLHALGIHVLEILFVRLCRTGRQWVDQTPGENANDTHERLGWKIWIWHGDHVVQKYWKLLVKDDLIGRDTLGIRQKR